MNKVEQALHNAYGQLDEAEYVIKQLQDDYTRVFKSLVFTILADVKAQQRKYVWEHDKKYIEENFGKFNEWEWGQIEQSYKHRYYPPLKPNTYEPSEEM